MQHPSRTTWVWAFAAWFACVSLLGNGWHLVFGDHLHGAHCQHGHVHAVAHVHQGTCHAAAAHGHVPASGLKLTAVADSDDHACPLCQFFGTAQCVDAGPAVERAFASCDNATRVVSYSRQAFAGFYLSRAPPACALLS